MVSPIVIRFSPSIVSSVILFSILVSSDIGIVPHKENYEKGESVETLWKQMAGHPMAGTPDGGDTRWRGHPMAGTPDGGVPNQINFPIISILSAKLVFDF
jgi:hypothetical protein